MAIDRSDELSLFRRLPHSISICQSEAQFWYKHADELRRQGVGRYAQNPARRTGDQCNAEC
jgi:hypothetical protein